ncbi:MAG: type II toxin-antitoxin system Phd/YefM family antitoxin [Bacteroidota bacterium]
MYSTRGIQAVASITELRSNTTELLDRARQSKSAILVQRNNDPHAVLISYDYYLELLDALEKKR